MREGARLAAAIACLAEIARGAAPADQILGRWARANRYAGSKDRRAINEQVYRILRHHFELAWAAGSDEPRDLVLAALARLDGLAEPAIAALFTGAGHDPAPLTDAERAMLKTATRPGAPDWAQANVPAWLMPEFEAAFTSHSESHAARELAARELAARELAALCTRAPVDLRVNTLKAAREEVCTRLAGEGITSAPTPLSPLGLRLHEPARVTATRTFRDGLVEIQDEGSQLVTLLSGARPGDQVLDLCAGAGGKTLALAAMMANKGQIYAADIAATRLAELKRRAERAGVRNLQTATIKRGKPPFAELRGKADLVLLDVPCSGTGAWRRHPEARTRLSEAALEALAAEQAALLDEGAAYLRPGGCLVYITCSLLPAENERQIAAFLDRAPAFAAEDPLAGTDLALPAEIRAPHGLLLTPARTGTDGFYLARLRLGQDAAAKQGGA